MEATTTESTTRDYGFKVYKAALEVLARKLVGRTSCPDRRTSRHCFRTSGYMLRKYRCKKECLIEHAIRQARRNLNRRKR